MASRGGVSYGTDAQVARELGWPDTHGRVRQAMQRRVAIFAALLALASLVFLSVTRLNPESSAESARQDQHFTILARTFMAMVRACTPWCEPPARQAARTTARFDSRPDSRSDGKTDGLADCHADGRADDRTDSCAYGRTDGHADYHADGRADGRTDGCADEHANGHADNASNRAANVNADAPSVGRLVHDRNLSSGGRMRKPRRHLLHW